MRLAVLMIFVSLAVGCYGQSRQTQAKAVEVQRMRDLVERWENRDGSDFITLSPQISSMLIRSSDVFFAVMSEHSVDFSTWMESLGGGTFTDYSAGPATLEKLRRDMITESSKFVSDHRYGKMARQLVAALRGIKVREID